VAVAHKLRFGAPAPNEPQADDGEVEEAGQFLQGMA